MLTCGIQLAICRGGGGHAKRIHTYPSSDYAERQIADTLSMVPPIDTTIGPGAGQQLNKE